MRLRQIWLHLLSLSLCTLVISPRQANALQDLGAVLQKADTLLDQAKSAYDEARTNRSVAAFVDAGFKLEEARIKYLVLQEIGAPEQQKTAVERLRAVNQLMKLVNDGKVAINSPPVPEPTAPGRPVPADPAAKPEPAAPPALPPPPIDIMKRHPVPEAKSLKDAEKLIRDLFKAEYAKKAPADRQALAKTLLQQAAQTRNDPAAGWVLCREAQDIAVQAGDVKTALAAVDETARAFDVDAGALRITVLSAVGKTVKQPPEFKILADSLLGLVDELLAEDQYEAADKIALQALQFSRRSGDVALALRATSRTKDVAEAKTRFAAMKKTLETLAKSSDDPPANLEMGKFLCFVKGSWDLGLRFLAKGSDAVLKALAEKELALPQESADLIAVADGWWDLADKETGASKVRARARSVYWYGHAFPRLEGLARLRAEKRLTEIEIAQTGSIDLLRLIDPEKDSVATVWKFEGGMLTNGMNFRSRLMIPYQPPEEYDLTISMSTTGDGNPTAIGLVAGSSQFTVLLEGWGKSIIQFVDKKDLNVAPGIRSLNYGSGNTFGKENLIVCAVRKNGFSITVNGTRAFLWEGPFNRLSQNPEWAVPNPQALFLGAWDRPLLVKKLTLTPVSGQGRRLR